MQCFTRSISPLGGLQKGLFLTSLVGSHAALYYWLLTGGLQILLYIQQKESEIKFEKMRHSQPNMFCHLHDSSSSLKLKGLVFWVEMPKTKRRERNDSGYTVFSVQSV